MTRVRSRNAREERVITQQVRTYPSVAVLASRNTTTALRYEYMRDDLTWGYPLPWLPVHQLNYSSQDYDEPYGVTSVTDLNGSRKWEIRGNTTQFLLASGWPSISLPSVVNLNIDSLIEQAKFECLQRFDKPRGSFGEPIAEVLKTIRTIRDPLYAIASTVTSFKKKRDSRRDHYMKNSKALANLWASYSFNLSPNVRTVNDAISQYYERASKQSNVKSCYATAKFSSGRLLLTTSPASFAGWTHQRQGLRSVEVKVKAGIYYKISDPNSTTSKLGLRNRDIPGVLWETLPLSFMIDRIYNVKAFINAASRLSSSLVTVDGGYVSVRVNDSRTRRYIGLKASGANTWTPADTTPIVESTFTLDRHVWLPTIRDALPPKMAGRLLENTSSILDLASLIISRLR